MILFISSPLPSLHGKSDKLSKYVIFTGKKFLYSFVAITLEMFFFTKASLLNNQPQFTVKAEANKAFDKSCLIGTFNTGDIADCLEHCLKDCRCQSFEICENTKCKLCSSHKEDNSSLLQENGCCIYATYEMQQLTKNLQVKRNFLIHQIQKKSNIIYPQTGSDLMNAIAIQDCAHYPTFRDSSPSAFIRFDLMLKIRGLSASDIPDEYTSTGVLRRWVVGATFVWRLHSSKLNQSGSNFCWILYLVAI